MVEIKINPYKSIVVLDNNGEDLIISEGNDIQFCLDSGLIKKGKIIKLIGKGDKLKIQLMPEGKECEEIWSILQISDGSLRLYNEDEDSEDEE